VQQVYVSGTAWTPAFKNYLQSHNLGDSTFGYEIRAGANQLAVLPWSGVNQVSIKFDQRTDAQSADLAIRGVNARGYAVSAFAYNAAANTATWTLSSPIANDRIVLDLDAGVSGVTSTYGLRLDGEWANAFSAYPSGNGVQGGDFRFRLNILGADANRDSRVNALDLAAAKLRLNTASTDAGRSLYTAFVDVTGDGRINALDLGAIKNRLNAQLPAAEPLATSLLAPAAMSGALFSTRRLDQSDVATDVLG